MVIIMKTTKKAARKTTGTKIRAVAPVRKKFTTVDEYMASLTGETKKAFKQLRKTIEAAAPEAKQVISYSIAAARIPEGGLIWYAGWKEHLSMYPWNDDMLKAIKGLDKYVASKGTIKFPLKDPIPFDLVTRMVKFRIKQARDGKFKVG